MLETSEGSSGNSIWISHFNLFMIIGILGYALMLVSWIVNYILAFLFIPWLSPAYPEMLGILLFLGYSDSTLIALAMIAYVKRMSGRFYGVFVLGWALAIGSTDVMLLLNSLVPELLYITTILIPVFEGISLWTSREQSRQPIYTAALSVLTAFSGYIVLLVLSVVFSFVTSFIPFLPPATLSNVVYALYIAYSSFVSVCFMLLLYLEIRRPPFAEMWDMQRSTISPQR
jgi:hypothetical protein